jgi:hypothetical protein
MRKILALLLLLASPVFAEFTATEKAELNKVVAARKSVTTGLQNIESSISTSTDAETRDLLAEADRTFAEVEEGLGNGLLFLYGTAAKRADSARDAIRAGGRDGYVREAFEAFDASAKAAVEAFEALDALASVRTDDSAFQLQVSRARSQLTSAVAKLTSFNRALAWNASTPIPTTILFQDQMWQARQYSYDVQELTNISYEVGPVQLAATNRKTYEVLSRVWLFTNEVMASATTVAGIDDRDRSDVRSDLLIDAQQYLHVIQVGLAGLIPTFYADLARTFTKNSDAWRHAGFGAEELLK